MASTNNGTTAGSEEKRSEPRAWQEEFHSVEFQVDELGVLYQSRIWNISAKGMCLLVKQDSDVLNRIKVSSVLDMKYYPNDMSRSPQRLKTKIVHITMETQGRFKHHCLIGLMILPPLSEP